MRRLNNATLDQLRHDVEMDIIDIVKNVRDELSKQYDVTKEPYYNYCGLCDMASIRCREEIIKKLQDKWKLEANVECMHGEQSHSTLSSSNKWPMEHTWVRVHVASLWTIYVDPTSGQFQDIYHDIPDYYVSSIKPKWYYSDEDNWRFNNKIGSWFTNHRCIKRKVIINRKKEIVHDSIPEFLQFEVWGRISDTIRRLK